EAKKTFLLFLRFGFYFSAALQKTNAQEDYDELGEAFVGLCRLAMIVLAPSKSWLKLFVSAVSPPDKPDVIRTIPSSIPLTCPLTCPPIFTTGVCATSPSMT